MVSAGSTGSGLRAQIEPDGFDGRRVVDGPQMALPGAVASVSAERFGDCGAPVVVGSHLGEAAAGDAVPCRVLGSRCWAFGRSSS